MFPISGGVVRFPHLSFGSFASYTMGWITGSRSATTAPIEVEGALQYATKYAPFTDEHTSGRRDGAHPDRARLRASRWSRWRSSWSSTTSASAGSPGSTTSPCGGSSRIIVLVIVAFLRRPRSTAATSPSHGFATDGAARHLHRDRDRRHRVLLPRLPPGHRAGRRDRQPEAQRPDRGDRLGAAHRRDLRAAAGRLHRRASSPAR